jgi:hypothetical protein
MLADSLATPTYGVTVTPTGSAWQTIVVTNGTAFTIAAFPLVGAAATGEITIEVSNTSGGAMGVITWPALVVFAGLVWTNPATGKKRWVRLNWNGANWVATAIAGADY